MSDNTLLNAPTVGGGDTIGADDIGGVKFQRVKLIFGADGTNAGDVSATNGLPTAVLGTGDYAPLYEDDVALNEESRIRIDKSGSLVARALTLTDEGSFSEPFAGVALAGTWTTISTGGGTVSVADSICSIASGTTSSATTGISREVDYSPMNVSFTASMSQRIANQDYILGVFFSTTQYIYFLFTGTNPTLVRCVSKSSSDTGGIEGLSTDFAIPKANLSSQKLTYKMQFNGEDVRFYSGIGTDEHLELITTHRVQVPNQYSLLTVLAETVNGSTPPVSGGTLAVDTIYCANYNEIRTRGEIVGNVSIDQNIISSPFNSSTTNLAAGATYTGDLDNTFNVAGIQVVLAAAVAVGNCTCTVFIDQSTDGTNWDITDQYVYISTRKFGITVQAVSTYFRVRVLNNSSATTTSFRLASTLCPIVESIPRSLTNLGNMRVAIRELEDQFGFKGSYSPAKSMQMAQPYRLVGTTFGTAIDANFWLATTGGGAGSASGVASGIATIASGTASGATGFGILTTTRSARFIVNNPHRYYGVMRVTSVAVANCLQRAWGPVVLSGVTPQNGAYFSIDTAGIVSCCTVSNTSITAVASGAFNGDLGFYTLDTNAHAFEIVFYELAAYFLIDDVLIHTIRPTTAVLYQTATTPIGIWSVNDGTGGTSGEVQCWNSSIERLGHDRTSPASSYFAGAVAGRVLKTGAGVLRSLVWSALTNNSTITIYDNTAASGTIIFAANTGNIDLPTSSVDFKELSFLIGMTVVTTGATLKATIIYE